MVWYNILYGSWPSTLDTSSLRSGQLLDAEVTGVVEWDVLVAEEDVDGGEEGKVRDVLSMSRMPGGSGR